MDVILDNIKIAVIDNGVADELLTKTLEYKVYVDNTNHCVIDNDNMEFSGFIHGTICAWIIENNFPECLLSSVKILNNDGIGKIDKLGGALEWCYQNNIFLVNLSLGLTHFRDKAIIRDIINHYANRGMVIVAATANSGYRTYPASFSNVIGVVAGKKIEVNYELQKQKGIDLIAISNYEVEIEGNNFRLDGSNSYATPYVTAMIGNILKDDPQNDVCSVRKKILAKEELTSFLYYPDWIENAWISEQCKRSEGKYYFNEVEGELETCIPMIDTIVVNSKEELKKCYDKKKHIVYLGKEPVENMIFDRFFWSREQKIAQIISCKERTKDIDMPLIICKFSENQDAILWLSVLKSCFEKDGYNVYTMSNKIEGVLYDLEFLPEELGKESAEDYVYNFLCLQTDYSQSDAVLLGANMDFELDILESIADMVIKINDVGKLVKMQVYCGGKLRLVNTVESINQSAISALYQEILNFFTEDMDE